MSDESRDRWMQDIDARQRNIVFPNTVENEARFWRNVGNPSWTPLTKVGLGVMAVWMVALAGAFLVAGAEGVGFWRFALLMLGVCGPIFLGISWLTRRALREIHEKRTRHQ